MFHFRLCLALGVIHPDYLLEKLSCRQLREWEIYNVHEPIGYMHSAVIGSVLANCNRGKDSDHVFKPEDFIHYYFPKKEKKQSMNQMKETMMKITEERRGKK